MTEKTTSEKNNLKSILGVGFGIAVTIGGVIGSGILYNPGIIVGLLQNHWLILLCWLLGGLYLLMAIGAYSELGTMIPKAGGPYNYAERAFGKYFGFLTGWFDFLVNSLAPAYISIAIAEYLALLFPTLKGYEILIAISIVVVFTAYHIGGVKNGDIFQKITSFLKVCVFAFLIIACFYFAFGKSLLFQKTESAAMVSQSGIVIAVFKSLQLIIGTYGGWNAACYFAEEFKNPGKELPKSLFIGVIIVIIIYILFNTALLSVVPTAVLSGSSLAASDAATIIFGKTGGVIFTLIAILSLTSILNAFIMVPSRILFGLSRSGHFIPQGATINKKGSPYIAMGIICLLEIVYIFSGSFSELFALGTFTVLIVDGLAYASVIKLRKSEPELHRPYRQKGYPFSTWLLIGVVLALLTGFAIADYKSLLILTVIVIASYPAFKLLKK
ncbi:MAG TPA: amino acid permease [Flavobacterium sp.]|nr:amino acid permease [Flavobacterium sp.]